MHEVSEFLAWMRDKRHASPNTLKCYRLVCAAFVAHDSTPLAERTPEGIEAFCARPRQTGRGASAATIGNEVSVLTSFYRWAQARHGYPTNPALLAGKPKVHNRQPRPVADALWLHVWTHDSLADDARVALGLGYFCGLRRAEIVRLRSSQVTWGRQLVNFTRKGGGEDTFDYGDVLDHFAYAMPQLIVDTSLLEEPLRRLARDGADHRLMPWGDTLAPKALNVRMARWLSECDVAPDAFTPHMLRHSFATNLVRSGVPLADVCNLCNHSSPAITMRYVKTAGGRLAGLRPGGNGEGHAQAD